MDLRLFGWMGGGFVFWETVGDGRFLAGGGGDKDGGAEGKPVHLVTIM